MIEDTTDEEHETVSNVFVDRIDRTILSFSEKYKPKVQYTNDTLKSIEYPNSFLTNIKWVEDK